MAEAGSVNRPKIVFVGAGAMGGAILQGIVEKKLVAVADIYVKERTAEKCETWEKRLGIATGTTYPSWEDVEMLVLAVKPPVLPGVLTEMGKLPAHVTVVSIAAGVSIQTLEVALPDSPIYRVMPNTPAAIGYGLSAISEGSKSCEALTCKVQSLFEAVGNTVLVSEEDLERLGAISGAGPAYVYLILDALANGGVKIGLARPIALQAATQTLLGAAQMVWQTQEHPMVLRDQVTSPGGTTIAGLAAMEAGGLRTALQEGVEACYARAQEMRKASER